MYFLGLRFLKKDDEMALKANEYFRDSTIVNESPLDGLETVLLIIQIADITISFAEFVIEYIIKPYFEKKKRNKESNNNSVMVSRCIVYNGKTITASYISSKLDGKECTPQNVLDIICDELK